MSDVSQGPGWWQASDGKWYPPEQAPGAVRTPPPGAPGAYGAPAGAPPAYGSAPAYGSPAGYGAPGAYGSPGGQPQLAEWGQRVVAYLIDGAITLAGILAVVIVGAVLGFVSDILALLVIIVGYVAVIGMSFYFFYLNGATGQSPGKALTGLKVVSESTGQVIGGGAGIVRYLAHIVDSLACSIGYFWPIWDDKKQTFADKIMKTVVISGVPKRPFGPDIFKA